VQAQIDALTPGIQGLPDARRPAFAAELLSRLLCAAFLRQAGLVPLDAGRLHGWDDIHATLAAGPLTRFYGDWPAARVARLDARACEAVLQFLASSELCLDERAGPQAGRIDPGALALLAEHSAGRRASGRYFTPWPVARFMARTALRAWLASRLPHEAPAALTHLLDTHDAGGLHDLKGARFALAGLRVCDPACGAGELLLALLAELHALRAALDEPAVCAHVIGAHSLWGWELDTHALGAARARLWLAAARACGPTCRHGESPDLIGKLALGDGLDAPSGRFDLVLANPPYLSTKRGFGKGERGQLAARFVAARGQFDAYALFLEHACEMLAPGGCYAYLVPRPVLTNSSMRPLRAALEQRQLVAIADLGTIFGAAVEAVVLVGRNATPADSPVSLYHARAATCGSGPTSWRPPSQLVTPAGTWSITGQQACDLERMQALPRLGGLLAITRGAERGKTDPALSTQALPGSYPLLRGQDVEAFRVCPQNYHLHRSSDAVDKPLAVQTSRKLLVRRVADRLIAAVDEAGFHTLNTLYMLTPLPGCPLALEYVGAALNSSTLKAYFRQVYLGDDRIFPYVRKEQLAALPLALPDAEQHQQAVTLARALAHEADTARRQTLWAELDTLIAAIYAGATI
jgi:hypothetical protein